MQAVEYITCDDNSFTTAANYAQNTCNEFGHKLISEMLLTGTGTMFLDIEV